MSVNMLVLNNETFSLNKYLNINNFRDCWTLQAFYSLTAFNYFLVFLILLVGKKKDLAVFSNTYIQKQNYTSSHGALRLLQKSNHKFIYGCLCWSKKQKSCITRSVGWIFLLLEKSFSLILQKNSTLSDHSFRKWEWHSIVGL